MIANNSDPLHCPRCGNRQIILYEDTFECPKCKLEFYIKDLEQSDDDDQILSIEEMKNFYDIVKEKK